MPDPTSIPVQLGSSEIVEGTDPITLIGANGAGKTRLGAYLLCFGYDRVSAQRHLTLGGIGMVTPESAKQATENQLGASRSETQNPVNDLHAIMAALQAED